MHKFEDAATPAGLDYSASLIIASGGMALLAGIVCIVDLVKGQ